MPGLRLLADDLTGALDSAAAFAPAFGKVRVIWHEAEATTPPALALDTGTRELGPEAASRRLAALAPFLATGGGDATRFFKVDSLLRGNAGRELLTLLAAQPFDHVVIAPAIPFQGRITRNGRQMIRHSAEWAATGEDIAATFKAANRPLAIRQPGDAIPHGVSLWDAATDADLDTIVAQSPTNTFWVGAAGLAGALARKAGASAANAAPMQRPLLGLIGTDHPAMQAQLTHCAPLHHTLGANLDAPALTRHLTTDGAAFLTCDLPQGLDRRGMETEIARRFVSLAGHIRPATLFVSGGETLRHLATGLGAGAMECTDQFEPGAPISRMIGGIWDRVPLISKSGAFGSPDFLARLLHSLSA